MPRIMNRIWISLAHMKFGKEFADHVKAVLEDDNVERDFRICQYCSTPHPLDTTIEVTEYFRSGNSEKVNYCSKSCRKKANKEGP